MQCNSAANKVIWVETLPWIKMKIGSFLFSGSIKQPMTDSHSTVSGTWRTMKALCMHNQSHQAAIKTRVPFENREEELVLSDTFGKVRSKVCGCPLRWVSSTTEEGQRQDRAWPIYYVVIGKGGFRWRGLVLVCETCLFNIGLTNLEEDLQFWGCWSNHKNNNMTEEQLRNLRGRKSHWIQRLPGFSQTGEIVGITHRGFIQIKMN